VKASPLLTLFNKDELIIEWLSILAKELKVLTFSWSS